MRYIDNVSEVIDFSGRNARDGGQQQRKNLFEPTDRHPPLSRQAKLPLLSQRVRYFPPRGGFSRQLPRARRLSAQRLRLRQQKLLARRLRNKPGLPQRQNRLRLLRLRVLLPLPLQFAFLIKKLSDKSRRAFFEIWRKSIFTRVARINGQTNLSRRLCATSRRA